MCFGILVREKSESGTAGREVGAQQPSQYNEMLENYTDLLALSSLQFHKARDHGGIVLLCPFLLRLREEPRVL